MLKIKAMIEFKDLPPEIQERMLDEQERQGNPRNAEVFKKNTATGADKGFFWAKSEEGHIFWERIILNGNLSVFYEKYPKRSLKVIPLHIKILDSKDLLEEIAEKLITKWHDEARPSKRVEIDWFEYGGFHWSANAEMEAEYVVTQYDYDTPPESHCKGMSIIIGNIECTDEDGNLVLVDYFDDERTRINEDDFVRKRIIDMEMAGD